MNNEPLFLRVDEAARLLSISRSKAYALIAAGDLPHVRIGSSIRVPTEALKKLANQGANHATGRESPSGAGEHSDAAEAPVVVH